MTLCKGVNQDADDWNYERVENKLLERFYKDILKSAICEKDILANVRHFEWKASL